MTITMKTRRYTREIYLGALPLKAPPPDWAAEGTELRALKMGELVEWDMERSVPFSAD